MSNRDAEYRRPGAKSGQNGPVVNGGWRGSWPGEFTEALEHRRMGSPEDLHTDVASRRYDATRLASRSTT